MNLSSWFAQRKYLLIVVGIILGGSLLSYSVLAYRKQIQSSNCDTISCVAVDSKSQSKASPTPTPSATPVQVQSYLDGLLGDESVQNLHPLAVMIENHPEARPQSGLSQASVVYEALAEGGISRFMAVYGNPTAAIKVGPVRSARPYFVDIATELNAFYAHVGGSTEALAQIKSTGVLDLNQFSVGSAAYAREPKAGIATEHTMYSSTEKLWKYATERNKWSKAGDYTPWTFQSSNGAGDPASTQSISVNLSSASYAVTWNYDGTSNTYKRTMAGAEHKDANTGSIIAPKNLILQTVERQLIEVKEGVNGWRMTLKGTGKATIFQNGAAQLGTWKKEGTGRTHYYDAAGKEVSFLPGLTWITLVHPDTPVTY